jgi:outer membrane protein W
MNRIAVVLLAGALGITLAGSSSARAAELSGGVKLGLNLADLHGKDLQEADPFLSARTGFSGGAFLEQQLSDVFAIQLEALYTQKGTKLKVTDGEDSVDLTLDLSYLEIPLLAKVYIPVQGKIRPNLFAGPALAVTLSAKLRDNNSNESEDIKDGLDGTDFGAVFGGGVDFDLGQGALVLDARYTLGLSKIGKADPFDSTNAEADVKNGAFSASVGYKF